MAAINPKYLQTTGCAAEMLCSVEFVLDNDFLLMLVDVCAGDATVASLLCETFLFILLYSVSFALTHMHNSKPILCYRNFPLALVLYLSLAANTFLLSVSIDLLLRLCLSFALVYSLLILFFFLLLLFFFLF